MADVHIDVDATALILLITLGVEAEYRSHLKVHFHSKLW